MRGMLVSGLVTSVIFFVCYLRFATLIKPRVPKWVGGALFGLMFALSNACGIWVGSALGWLKRGASAPDLIALTLGAAIAGGLLGSLIVRDRVPRNGPGS